MSILINKETKVITQGITGKTGQFHTRMCRDYANGKNCFVAGVNPKKAGENFEEIPIYATVKEAKQATGATVSVIYVPPAGAADAIWEAVEADLEYLHVPTDFRTVFFSDETKTLLFNSFSSSSLVYFCRWAIALSTNFSQVAVATTPHVSWTCSTTASAHALINISRLPSFTLFSLENSVLMSFISLI